ncbi:MAG: T9SS type A sorting domain-containing protein [Bacteroidetes bacterium]|nr:T9SS type A sorting domain-containing protein [Bacteroidota bacterium]
MKKFILISCSFIFSYQISDAQLQPVNKNPNILVSGKTSKGGEKNYKKEFVQQTSGSGNTISGNTYSWRFYNTGNTGIQGDYAEAVRIDHDGDPYIAAYTPGWEEGGFAKFIQADNRWINYSNVDYPVIGNINDVGASRISDIEEDTNGILWMATWRGILKFNPAAGGSSLEFFGAKNSIHPGGRTMDLAIAPDGSVWAAVLSVVWGNGGLVNYNPATNLWRYWHYGSTENNWPSLIGFCENVSVQKKNTGGYVVWVDGAEWNTMITFDSDSQLFTLLPQNQVPGEVVALPGTVCIDDANNLWAFRYTDSGNIYSLDYRTPTGNWITPPQPLSNSENNINAFKAYGSGKAILVDGNSNVWNFSGTSWQNYGVWREGGFSYGVDIDNDGNVWATGIGGAAKRNAQTGIWQRYRITNTSQMTYWVEDITIDNDGNVWMAGNAGTGVGGFQKFDGTRWTGHNEFTYGLGYPFPFPTDNAEVLYFRPSNGNIIVNPMFNYLHSWNGSSYTSLNYPNDRSQGVAEDSQNRLWSLGEYYDLKYYSDNIWTSVPFMGWGSNIKKDPSRPGTVWACSGYQVLRTDGIYNFSKVVNDFTELDPQSDVLTTVIPAADGFAWVGTNQGLAKLNSNNGTYEFYSPSNSQIPGENISPLAISPDGRLWFANFGSSSTSVYGLCWFDGTNFGIIPQQQIGGLPHAQIYDIEVKNIQNGYELWISCASTGVAVLTVNGSPSGIINPETQINFITLEQNYPNPFNPVTIIRFTVNKESFTELKVFDITGREVASLLSENLKAGVYEKIFNASSLPGGTYFYTLRSSGFSESKKMILLK